MISNQFKALIQTNLVYANPSATNQLRKKNVSGSKLYKSIVRQQLLLAVMFTVIYGGIMFLIDFSKYPGYFTSYMGLYFILAFSQGISTTFNIFYDSKDIKDYLPLPFKETSILLAKYCVVGLTMLPFVLPILALLVLAAIKSSTFILISLVLALVLFCIFLILMISLCTLIVTLLVQLKSFNRHKTLYTTLLMIIPNILMIVGVVYFTQMNTYSVGQTMQDRGIIVPFYPFFLILIKTFTVNSFLSIILFAALLGIMYQISLKVIIPRIYSFSLNTDNSDDFRSKKIKTTSYQPLPKQLFRYNVSLLKNPTLVMQFIFTTVMFPLIFLFSAGLSMPDLSNMGLKFWVTFLLIGFAYGTIGVNSGSMVSVILSLDRENFLFIRSLPIRFKNYLYIKFVVATGIQLIVTSLLIIVLAAIFKLPIAHIVALLLGNLLGIYLFGLHYFYRDYRFLSLNWGNVTELFNRGSGSWGQVGVILGTIVLALVVIGGLTVLIMFIGFATIITLIVLIALTVATFLVTRYYQQNFFNKFN